MSGYVQTSGKMMEIMLDKMSEKESERVAR